MGVGVMKLRALRRGALGLALPLLVSAGASAQGGGQTAFPSYCYDEWGRAVRCPDPYTLVRTVSGLDLGLGEWRNLNDVFTDGGGQVYIALSGTEEKENCLLRLDADLSRAETFYGYTDGNGQAVPFEEPLGVFVTGEGEIYLADGKRKEILHMDASCRLIRAIGAPAADSGIVAKEFAERYRPSKVAVDPTGRIHVVAVNVNEGIVEFSASGEFKGFLAAGKVTYSAMELLWRRLSTRKQRERMQDFVPIEYNNICLDDKGFLFSTLSAGDPDVVLADIRAGQGSESGAMVRRLNLMGTDILGRSGNTGPQVGDLDVDGTSDASYTGISQITDVAAGDDGTYFLLDQNRSHLFAYDSEGNMLYAFSGPDVSAGGMRTPTSLAVFGDNLYALDTGTRRILQFARTAYGRDIAQAIACEKRGETAGAQASWRRVLARDPNSSLAYAGLGKIAYQNKDYAGAMELFARCDNKSWYSKAFAQQRKQLISAYFAPCLAGAVGLIALLAAVSGVRRAKRRTAGGGEKT